MQKKKKTKLLYFAVIPLSVLIMSLIFVTTFEYTAVAEIKESFAGVDKQETQAYGKVLFETRGCSSCHAIESNLKGFGPNLSGLSQRQTEEYIRQSIVSPQAVIVKGFPDVIMPNFGEILDTNQVDALVEYVSSIE